MTKILFIILMTLFFSCNTESDINELKYWTYEINYDFEPQKDSIRPIGLIKFSRNKSVKDKLREEVYNEPWLPSMWFEIYNISDLKYCEEISKRMKMFSSCIDAWRGGDLILNQNYIFYNNSGCLNCVSSENEIDFCRPITNKILSELELTEKSSLEDIGKEIGKKLKRAK